MSPQQRPRSLSAEFLVILIAALAAGFLEAALIATHRIAGVDPFNYVPVRVWLIVPLAWIAIAGALAVPAYVLSRRQGMRIVLSAMTALLLGCRIALVSRKWGLVALLAVFLALFWILRRVRLPELRSAGVWLTALFVIAACGAGVAIPGPAPRPAAPAAAGPNVLIIVADTVRHDAVFQPDGSVKPELPSLQRFAGESTIFDAAYAASSWTLPSHFSAMTGLESHELGLDFDHQTFRKPALMLAERFHRKGYRTAAVISNPFLHERSGFARGFDSYDHAGRALDLCRTAPLTILSQLSPRFAGTVCGWSATQVTERALQHMNDDTAPYLVVLNFMDAHEPSYIEPQCRAGVPARHNTFLRLQVREAPLYHAAIRCLDRSLGVLFDRAGASSRGTVVVFLSDHGEHLGERGLMGHGQTLYPQLVHVPLMIRTPDHIRARIGAPVSLIMLPSLLTSGQLQTVPERAVISTLTHSVERGRKRMISVIRGPWQLITAEPRVEELIDLRTETQVPVSPFLPQLRADTAAVQRSWPRLPEIDFRSVGYIH